MSLISCRVLPPAEWPRLRTIEPFASRGLPDDPDSWAILVVETDEGEIVGTCSLFTAMHWDAWWIDPNQPGTRRGIILAQLLREAFAAFRQAEIAQVYTGVEDEAVSAPAVADLLTRFGFTPAPGRLYLLQVAEAALRLKARREGP